MKITKLMSMFLAALFFMGCAHRFPAPGDITVVKSEFDGTVEVSMEPARVCLPGASVCTIKLDLMHNSKMKPDQAMMRVLVMGLEQFAPGEAVKFNIDGEIVGLTSIDTNSTHDERPGMAGSDDYWTSQRYMVDKQFIEKLLNGKRVVVRVDLQKSFAEGIFSDDKPHRARNAFRQFYKQVFSASI